MNRYEAQVALRQRFTLAEGPIWLPDTERLVWVDIFDGRVLSATLSPDGLVEAVDEVRLDVPVGAVAPDTEGGLVLAAGSGFYHLDRHGTARIGAQPDEGRAPRTRMNDGACDPAGTHDCHELDPDDLAQRPHSGFLFTAHVDTAGLPPRQWAHTTLADAWPKHPRPVGG